MTEGKNISFVFVNFDVGFNLGYIASYLVKQFSHVALYKVYFRDLVHDGASEITVYERGKRRVLENPLGFKGGPFQQNILSYLIVLVGMVRIKMLKGFQKATLVTPNPYFLFFGFLIGWRTIYVVGDRMRVGGKTRWVRSRTRVTKFMTEVGVRVANYVWFISQSLREHFKQRPKKHFVKTMGIQPNFINWDKKNKTKKVIYVGTFNEEKGVNVILKVATKMRDWEFILIGNNHGIANHEGNMRIYPPVIAEENLKKIIGTGNLVAVAPYILKKGEKYLGDPTKVKQYLSYGLPVVTTTGVEFSEELTKYQAGEIIRANIKELSQAIQKISDNYPKYRNGVRRLVKNYHINKIYRPIFRQIKEANEQN